MFDLSKLGAFALSLIAQYGSIADLRIGGRWFDLRLGQHSFRGLMKNIVRSTG